MTTTFAQHQPQILKTHQQSFAATFPQILRKIQLEAYLRQNQQKLKKCESPNKQITIKMRCKVLSWLEKLCVSTFQFQRSTFIITSLILDQYLNICDDSPKELQMIGCVSLFIASKLNQTVIVSPQSYITACCSIFDKNQLLQKQLIIYSQINWKTIRFGAHNLIKSGCSKLNIQQKYERSLQLLCLLIKQENNWNQLEQTQFILAVVIAQEDNPLQNEQFLRLSQNYQ